MAVQLESQNQLLELLDMLKRRLWWIVLPALIVGSIGAAVVVFLPKKYEVKAQVKIEEQRVDDPGKLANNQKGTATQREIQNAQYQVLQSDRIISILEDFDWQDYREKDDTERWEYTQRVQRNIKVNVLAKASDVGSTYIDIYYKDTDADRAETFLNALALRWQQDLQEGDIENLQRDLATTKALLDEHEQSLLLIEKQISEKQQELEIFPSANPSTGRDQDPLLQRRQELEAQRDLLVLELGAAKIRLDDLKQDFAEEPATLLLSAAAVAAAGSEAAKGLTLQIENKKLSLAKLKPGNSKYQALSDEIRSLETQKVKLLELEQASAPEAQALPNPRKEDLRRQVDQEEREIKAGDGKLADLEVQIDELTDKLRKRSDGMAQIHKLEHELKSHQDALAKASEKHENIRTNLRLLESRDKPYSIVEPARAPKAPTEPNVFLLLSFVVVAGIGLGFVLALGVEFSQPGFRSPGEAVRALSVPVLGVVDAISTGPERRRRNWNRLVVGISSSLLIGSFAWFAWAWSAKRELLGTDLALWLTQVQEQLK
jgi:uncharacterized protein involved in exopolysaccharide biosynthesis